MMIQKAFKNAPNVNDSPILLENTIADHHSPNHPPSHKHTLLLSHWHTLKTHIDRQTHSHCEPRAPLFSLTSFYLYTCWNPTPPTDKHAGHEQITNYIVSRVQKFSSQTAWCVCVMCVMAETRCCLFRHVQRWGATPCWSWQRDSMSCARVERVYLLGQWDMSLNLMNKPQMVWDELEWITKRENKLKLSNKKLVAFMLKANLSP